MELCKATTAKGDRCKGRPLEDGFCFAHSPDLQNKLSESRRAGGRNRSHATRARRYMPPDLRAITDKLVSAIDEVHDGLLEPRQATAMAALSGAVVKLYETGELEQRLTDLEARIEQQPNKRRYV